MPAPSSASGVLFRVVLVAERNPSTPSPDSRLMTVTPSVSSLGHVLWNYRNYYEEY